MSQVSAVQSSTQSKRTPVPTTTVVTLSRIMASSQSLQSATNEALKAINKSINDIKLSVDKLANLKSSVDQINANMASLTTKFQDFEARLDVMEIRMGEVEFQTSSNYKEIAKLELETSAKVLRLQNVPLEKDGRVYNVVVDIIAPILQTFP